MPKYIDAEKLEQRLRDFSDWCRDNRKDGVDFVLNGVLADTPTADVQEVRHGKMNIYKPRSMNRNATYKCSVCGKLCSSYYNDVGEWNFCPYCGAKMDK